VAIETLPADFLAHISTPIFEGLQTGAKLLE